MSRLRAAAFAALLGGLAVLAYAAMQGQLRVGLLLFIPFVYGEGVLALLGFALLMAAVFLGFARAAASSDATRMEGAPPLKEGDVRTSERRHGGVILLGPIPIVWGSDRGIAKWMVLAGAALLVLALLLVWAAR